MFTAIFIQTELIISFIAAKKVLRFQRLCSFPGTQILEYWRGEDWERPSSQGGYI